MDRCGHPRHLCRCSAIGVELVFSGVSRDLFFFLGVMGVETFCVPQGGRAARVRRIVASCAGSQSIASVFRTLGHHFGFRGIWRVGSAIGIVGGAGMTHMFVVEIILRSYVHLWRGQVDSDRDGTHLFRVPGQAVELNTPQDVLEGAGAERRLRHAVGRDSVMPRCSDNAYEHLFLGTMGSEFFDRPEPCRRVSAALLPRLGLVLGRSLHWKAGVLKSSLILPVADDRL